MAEGGESLQPTGQAHKAAECCARNARRRDLQQDVSADPPLLPQSSLIDIEAHGGQVLPKGPIRQLAHQLLLPCVQILTGVRIDRLAIAPVMLPVTDEVPHQAAPEPDGLGTWSTYLDWFLERLLTDTGGLVLLVGVGLRPPDVDRLQERHRARLRRREATADLHTWGCGSAVSFCGCRMKITAVGQYVLRRS